ncbi:MAG: sodium ion-translocating decarboxylase subunit beta [Clostridia bacterium]|nr:sodium ion-translocating decarboxylase subunit beta [Clostridia bacterium]
MKLSNRALKIICTISGIFTILGIAYPSILKFIICLKMEKEYNINHASSIGIIGGADGPTAIFIADKNPALEYVILSITSIITVISLIILIKRKLKK